MNLATIQAEAPFLDLLARGWLRRAGDDPLAVAAGLVLLPTRRAARALAEAFLRAGDGRPMLLPRIVALGALDETPLALGGALDLPPAVEPARRLAELARLIVAMGGGTGGPTTADAAWRLAAELARLMDEAERAEIDLAARLPGATDGAFAEHWQITERFLRIVTAHWPLWLDQQGLLNPAARQVALLRLQAASWRENSPDAPVWAAGMTGGMPAVAALLRSVAALPDGLVVLPGLDRALPEAVWEALDEVHPQAGLRRLLIAMGATRGDVRGWPDGPAVPGRAAMLARALLPASGIGRWRSEPLPGSPAGLSRLYPADEQEEAAAIALVLREALETPGARAALVTPDRALARRVAAELTRFGVIADDSAGEPLTETPPAVFLRLLAAAAAADFAPVELLALLKHPLAAAGLDPAACRAAARGLELIALRGQRPQPRLGGVRRRFDQAGGDPDGAEARLLAHLEQATAPLLRAIAAVAGPPAALLHALIESAEALAATQEATGAARLWHGEEGEALADLLAAALDAIAVLPDQAPRVLPGLLDALLEGAVVRTRRALRGRDGAEHPRVFIWGLIEARLQSVETVVLGGLVEGVWPPASDPGPWLSRPMRQRVGLASPEEAIGQAAHDFAAAACAAPVAILSSPRRRDGAPAVPARWLVRLEACLGQTALASHDAIDWSRALDQPSGGPRPASPPKPRPPVAARPRRLTVSDVETWLKDPYAIHAKYVLRLRPLDPLDQATEHADFGTLVHAALHKFVASHGTALPGDTAGALRLLLRRELASAELRKALTAWWQPRLDRIADWLAEQEAVRRQPPLAAIAAECPATWTLAQHGGRFILTGRADRIERWADGRIALLDYKTGAVPTRKEVRDGRSPQLPLEAAMARSGAFGTDFAGEIAELVYLRLTGDRDRGEVVAFAGSDLGAVIAHAEDGLRSLIDSYDDPRRAYLARPVPHAAPRFGRYAQLARVAEWALLDDAEP